MNRELLKILRASSGPMCVNTLSAALGLAPIGRIVTELSLLMTAGLVKRARGSGIRTRWCYQAIV